MKKSSGISMACGYEAFTNVPGKTKAERQAWMNGHAEGRKEGIRVARNVVESEGELDGKPPLIAIIYMAFHPILSARAAVRATKQSILKRLDQTNI
jgi:hypothetical protein